MAEIGTPISRRPSTRISYDCDVLKSLIRSVAEGFSAFAASNTSFTSLKRPYCLHILVIALSYLSNTGMITTSFITSHIFTRPLNALTSLWIRASCFSRITSFEYSISQLAHAVCQQSGCPFTVMPWSLSHCAWAMVIF